MANTDAQLAARAARGDMAAFEALYRRHVERVWRYAWLRTHSRHDAAEIVQETFLRVTRSIRGFKRGSTFTTWLYAVTRSVAVDLARRRQREKDRIERAGVLQLPPTERREPESVAIEEVRREVRQAVAALPGAQRDAVVLCELSGLGLAEAAEVLNWSQSRVKVTLFRARRRLRDRLRSHVSDEATPGNRKKETDGRKR